jgi:membrane protein required for colicin V production
MQILLAMGGQGTLFGGVSVEDLVVVAVLVFSAVIGFWSGFIWQVVRIITLVACLAVTLFYAPIVAASVPESLGDQAARLEVAAVGVFVTTLTVCYLISFLFRDLVNALKPQLTDRILGAVFGLLKGALLIAIVVLLVLKYSGHESPIRKRVEQSRTAVTMGGFLWYTLPDTVREQAPQPPEP